MSEQQRPLRPRPVEVRHLRDQGLVRISWADGHVGDYPYAYLRGWCPCAACQGHGNERHFVHTQDPQLRSIEQVGNYAFNFLWADGHETGIYSYVYLRELCPCAACAPPEAN